MTLPARFLLTHLWLPLAVFGLLALGLELSELDLWLADQLYAWEGGTWALRDAWVTSELIHEDGRRLVGVLLVLVLAALAGSHFLPRLRRWRRPLWYLLASAVTAALFINVLKETTHVDCPWDLLRYGGEFPYIHKFAPHPGDFRHGACFPAGHASAGYSWLGLYYVALLLAPRWRWSALGAAVSLGLVFGIGQQLRGAHFISHDLWTAGLCWLSATLVYWLFAKFPRNAASAAATVPN